VIEKRTAVRAIGRSRELVRGHGWQVFSVLIVTLMIILLVDTALVTAAAAISDGRGAFAVANFVARVLTGPIFGLSSAVLYLELRKLKGEPLPPAGALS
jgi:hypothetical protein